MFLSQVMRIYRYFLCVLTIAFFYSHQIQAQQNEFTLTTERPSARYEVGENIQFNVTGENHTVDYRIWQDKNTPTLNTGNIQLQNGLGHIQFQHPQPNLLIVEATQNGKKLNRAVAVDPFNIDALEEEPSDFDDFWKAAKSELQNVPLDPQLTFHSSDNYSTTYRVNLGHIDDRRVYGYISIPNGTGPFPAVLHLPSFGGDANQVRPQVNICRDLGAISMTISIHNAEPDEKDPNAYQPNDITDPFNNYYRQAILGCLQAINYLFTRSDFSEDLVVTGVSQGAGLAVMTAGLDERVKFLTYSGVTHAQHQGFKYDQASGFPYYLHQVRNFPQEVQNATRHAAQYYESIYFARRYKGVALAAVGYLDNITHAATQLAVFNALQGKKILIHGKNTYHTHPAEFWRLQYDMTLQQFPYARTFAWQYASDQSGYKINIDSDTNISIQNSMQLQASVEWNDMPLTRLEIEWTKLEGPGEIVFENANSLTPSLSFTAPGRYVIQLRAHDYRILDSKAIYYTLEDKVVIEVEDKKAESQLSIACPDDLEIWLPEGENSALVDWEVPSFESVCEQGEASLQQISGPEKGSIIQTGIYEIDYVVSNPCGDSLFCTLYLDVIFTAIDEGYCDNKGEQPWQEWIEEVRLSDLQFFSQKEGYGDFTHYVAELHPDSSYTMSVQVAYSYLDTTEHITAYIDFDQDSIFQVTELILQGAITTPPTSEAAMQILQSTIFTPPDASLGKTRLRVILSRSTSTDACTTVEYGEVEDYSILFKEKPDDLVISNTKNDKIQQVSLYPNPVGESLNVAFSSKQKTTAQFVVIDNIGRVVQQQSVEVQLGKGEYELEVETLPSGFYILQVYMKDQVVWNRKFIK